MTDDVLITPLDLTHFTASPETINPGFAQLVGDTLGTSASSLDGFDAVWSDAAAIVEGLDAALGLLAGDLTSAFAEADLVDPAAAAANAAAFAVTADGVATAVQLLGVFVGADVPPVTGGGGAAAGCKAGDVVGGLIVGKADPHPYPAIPGYHGPLPFSLGVKCVGDAPQLVQQGGENGDPPNFMGESLVLTSGDPAIFSVEHEDTISQGVGQSLRQWFLVVTPAKAGRFQAVTELRGTPTGTYFAAVNVTIVQKG